MLVCIGTDYTVLLYSDRYIDLAYFIKVENYKYQ